MRIEGTKIAPVVSVSHVKQTTILSLSALRRLHFPLLGAKAKPETDLSAQTLLAALALCAVTYARRDGNDLRSRCVLIPTAPALFELLGSDATQASSFSLTPDTATDLFNRATSKLEVSELGWNTQAIKLVASPQLIALDRKSRALKKPLEGDGDEAET
jgi:CRISPR-associated protein Csb1